MPAMTLSEDKYNDLMAKVDIFEHALRSIHAAVSLEDGESWDDPYSLLESIDMEINELVEEGYLT
jgi:hypothetical protein